MKRFSLPLFALFPKLSFAETITAYQTPTNWVDE